MMRVLVGLCTILLLATGSVLATFGPDASRLSAIPNGDLVFVNGHPWPNPLRITPRGSAAAGESAFGVALAAAGNVWTSTLCGADSDGDGFTNGEELGDPACTWTPGAVAARTTDISNPGVWSSVPTTSAYPQRTQTYAPATCTRPNATLPDRDSEGNALRTAIDLPAGMSGVAREAELAKVREPDADEPHYSSTYGSCPHAAQGLKMWHDAATWGGTVPASGADVTLPTNSKVLVTSCSVPDAGFGRITIPATSELIFDDAPAHLRAKAIDVNGGIYIGSKECPIKSPITITLSGTKAEMSTYNNGINVLGSGKADFFGWTQERTWTRLKTTAAAGHFKIVTLHPTTWAHGDEIVIATSIWKDTEKDENEVRRIVARDSTNSSILLLDRPLNFKHYAGHEYQSEVALLTRTIMIRGGTDAQSMTVDCYGGHTWAVGPNATYRMVGVRGERMGQRNVMARYPFHFHMMYEGGNGNYFQQCAVTNSYYRGYTVHGTNGTLLRKNVAYNTTGHTYYLEDGGEMLNTIEFNIAMKVAIIGAPASDGAQSGSTVTESTDLRLPADVTASGFYLSNAHNWIRGNAASGGWAGYAFPVFDTCVKLSAHLSVIPKEMHLLEFDGNTCHSSGHHWGAAGCVYAGGRLWFEEGVGKYTHGRIEHPTKFFNGSKAWQQITNFRAWLTQKGYSSWGDRVDITNMECHDCTRTAVLFGESSVHRTLYNAISENRPADMRTVKRTAFQFYDVWVKTMLVNITLRNIYTRPFLNSWERPNAGIVDITHSDIFKPWGISAVRDVRFENSDRRQLLGRLVRESGASRMFNIMDWDGSFVNSPSCEGQIIGSEIDWWNAFDDCWWEREWMAWVCPRKPGREVVGVDADFGSLQERLDIQPSSSNGYMLTQSQRDQLYIGHISYFGSNANKKLIITKNHHLATGISGTAWYMWVSSGIPETFKLEAKNFPRGAYILMAIGLPSDATVASITTEKRWGNNQRFAFTSVASRADVLIGNGTQYHFDGRHLYIKMSDLYSTYPNQFSRAKVDIYKVYSTHGFYTINLNCPSKNSAGRCAVNPTTPDPPSDIGDLPITVCPNSSALDPGPLCPDETNLNYTRYPDLACSELTWQCDGALPDYCRQSCLPDCKRLAPYPYTCSLDRGCEADEKPPAVKDWCAALTSTDERPTTSDPCHVAWCNQTANSTVRFQQSEHHPCTDYDDGGLLLDGRCSMGQRKCKGTSQSGNPVRVQPLPADPTKAIEVSVTVVNGTVSSVVAHYRLAHEGKGLPFGLPTVPSSRSGTMSLVSTSPCGLTHHFRLNTASLGGAVSGNVTFVVATSAHGTESHTITDWRDVAKFNVVIDEARGDSPAGSIIVNVHPIDFVVDAKLLRVNPHTKQTLEAVSLSSTAFSADNTVRMDVASGTLPSVGQSEALAVKVTLTSGTTMQATLPCASRTEGEACENPVLAARDYQDACRVRLEGTSFNNWWLAFNVHPDASAVTALIGVQASGNKSLSRSGNGFGDNPRTSMASEDVTVVARYADGSEDVFSTFGSANFPSNGEFLRCVRGSMPNKDHLYADRIPTPAAKGACVARQCVLGMIPFTTTAAPATTTTTTTSAATTTSAMTTATTTTAATTAAATTTDTTTAATSTSVTTTAAATTTVDTTTTATTAADTTTSTPTTTTVAPTATTVVTASTTTADTTSATTNADATTLATTTATTTAATTTATTTAATTTATTAATTTATTAATTTPLTTTAMSTTVTTMPSATTTSAATTPISTTLDVTTEAATEEPTTVTASVATTTPPVSAATTAVTTATQSTTSMTATPSTTSAPTAEPTPPVTMSDGSRTLMQAELRLDLGDADTAQRAVANATVRAALVSALLEDVARVLGVVVSDLDVNLASGNTSAVVLAEVSVARPAGSTGATARAAVAAHGAQLAGVTAESLNGTTTALQTHAAGLAGGASPSLAVRGAAVTYNGAADDGVPPAAPGDGDETDDVGISLAVIGGVVVLLLGSVAAAVVIMRSRRSAAETEIEGALLSPDAAIQRHPSTTTLSSQPRRLDMVQPQAPPAEYTDFMDDAYDPTAGTSASSTRPDDAGARAARESLL